ncbi:MAG: hypothetical protein KJ607_04920, partial [Bacteroidetes bacterium]|nr:hypothetical protein [Bacteroidota bacterium]
MAEETQYTANTGMVEISTADSALDNPTNYQTVLTGAGDGTLVSSINIKAIETTEQGMVRFFIYNGSDSRLISEVEIPAVTKSSTDPAFEINFPVDFALDSGCTLRASTEKNRKFHIIADGRDWDYYAGSVRPESSNYTAQSGLKLMNKANTSLDGSGTTTGEGPDMWILLTGASNGTVIKRVIIKAIERGTVTAGMLRLFINNGGGDGTAYTKLLKEIPVQAVTQSATAETFSADI